MFTPNFGEDEFNLTIYFFFKWVGSTINQIKIFLHKLRCSHHYTPEDEKEAVDPLKRRFLLETTIFRCYVSFRECITI